MCSAKFLSRPQSQWFNVSIDILSLLQFELQPFHCFAIMVKIPFNFISPCLFQYISLSRGCAYAYREIFLSSRHQKTNLLISL